MNQIGNLCASEDDSLAKILEHEAERRRRVRHRVRPHDYHEPVVAVVCLQRGGERGERREGGRERERETESGYEVMHRGSIFLNQVEGSYPTATFRSRVTHLSWNLTHILRAPCLSHTMS